MNFNRIKSFIGNRFNSSNPEESNKQEAASIQEAETDNILEIITEDPMKTFKRALQLFEQERYEEAEPILRIFADAIDFPQSHLLLGSVYMHMGNQELAEKYWLNAAEKHKLPEGHFALGHFYKCSNFEKSLYHFEKAFADEKTKLKASTQLGLLHLEKNEIEQAKNYFEEPAKNKVQEAYAGLGMVYLHKNNRDLALQYFMQAPNVPMASYQIGLIFLKEEKYKRALSYFHKAADKYNIGSAHYVLGILYKQKDKIKETKKYLHNAADYHKIAEAFSDLGRLYFRLNELDQAVHYFKIAADTHGIQDAYLPLGAIYRMQNNYDEAKKYLELALNDAKDPEAHVELGLLYHALDNIEEAKKHWHISADKYKNSFAHVFLKSLEEKKSDVIFDQAQ